MRSSMKLTTETHDEDEFEDNNVYITVTGSTVIRNGCEALGCTPDLEDENEL